jgi:hypothetical protein
LGSLLGSQVESKEARRRRWTREALSTSPFSTSAVVVRMIFGGIGVIMRTPDGKQGAGKEEQPDFFFSQGEQKRPAHN